MHEGTDDSFLRRVSDFESQLSELTPSRVEKFNVGWSSFVKDLKEAIDAETLQISTIVTAHALGSRVSQITQTFLDLEHLAARLMTSLLDETSTILEPSTPATLPLLPYSSPDSGTTPPYLKPSYEWLALNVHNPYPLPSVRDGIAKGSGAARKDIDNWFIDARKRIGWNAARKAHFSNKRVDIVDAATRFFAGDEKLILEQDAELALISIMRNVKDLYSDKFSETSLAAQLATVVKDLTPQTKAAAKAERTRQQQLRKDQDAYPSPARSPEPTRLSTVPCDDEIDNTASHPTSTNNRKRRSPSVEAMESQQSEEPRPAKRTRVDAPIDSSIHIGLPSPATSIDEPLQAVEPLISLSAASPPPVVPSRKRRLSESDGQGLPKRPHNLSAATRLHAVSDPRSLSSNLLFDESSFDGWFQQTFGEPEIGEISPSGFSIELGSLSDFDCNTPAATRSVTPEHTEPAEQIFQPPAIEADIPSILDTHWSDGVDFWTDQLFAPSDLATSSGLLVNFAGHQALPVPLAQDLSNFQFVPRGSQESNEFESLYNVSNINTVVTPLVPTTNEVWDFTASGLNSQDAAYNFGKHDGNFAGILPSYGYALNANILPSPGATYLPTPLQDKVREEKEREYRAAMEKANRLALELRGEGVAL
ncbi:hypothetical protein H0H87_010316 [Tephrocybe sp. NHM501043]|nr:hypothetical protein H0H87_010316 [Tephrocybe sp. NHM501043]